MRQIARGRYIHARSTTTRTRQRGLYIVDADTECSPIPNNDANTVATYVVMLPAYSLYACAYDHTQTRMWSHLGEQGIYEMFTALSTLADECKEQLKTNTDNDNNRRTITKIG